MNKSNDGITLLEWCDAVVNNGGEPVLVRQMKSNGEHIDNYALPYAMKKGGLLLWRSQNGAVVSNEVTFPPVPRHLPEDEVHRLASNLLHHVRGGDYNTIRKVIVDHLEPMES